MGQSQPNHTSSSREAVEDPSRWVTGEVDKIEGFQVMRLVPNGVAAQSGLCPYFDFITHLNEHNLSVATVEETPMAFFRRLLAEHYHAITLRQESAAQPPLLLTVYNLRCRCYRQLKVFLRVHASKEQEGVPKGGLLGCSIEWRSAKDAVLSGSLHILEILKDSPFYHASMANPNNNNNNNENHSAAAYPVIQAERDYIIGMQATPRDLHISMLKGEKDLQQRVEAFQAWQHMCVTAEKDREEKEKYGLLPKGTAQRKGGQVPRLLLFLLYNAEGNTVEEIPVEMDPSYSGRLGVRVGSGLMHTIPSVTPKGEGEPTELPQLIRYFIPRDYSFEVDFSEEQGRIRERQPPVEEGLPTETAATPPSRSSSVPPLSAPHMEGSFNIIPASHRSNATPNTSNPNNNSLLRTDSSLCNEMDTPPPHPKTTTAAPTPVERSSDFPPHNNNTNNNAKKNWFNMFNSQNANPQPPHQAGSATSTPEETAPNPFLTNPAPPLVTSPQYVYTNEHVEAAPHQTHQTDAHPENDHNHTPPAVPQQTAEEAPVAPVQPAGNADNNNNNNNNTNTNHFVATPANDEGTFTIPPPLHYPSFSELMKMKRNDQMNLK